MNMQQQAQEVIAEAIAAGVSVSVEHHMVVFRPAPPPGILIRATYCDPSALVAAAEKAAQPYVYAGELRD